jgi:hypothetical protein
LLTRTLIAAATAISAAMLQATKLLFLVAAEGSSRAPAGRRRALLGDLGWVGARLGDDVAAGQFLAAAQPTLRQPGSHVSSRIV